jgi:hypothetical protein
MHSHPTNCGRALLHRPLVKAGYRQSFFPEYRELERSPYQRKPPRLSIPATARAMLRAAHADSDDVDRVYRFEVARGFPDDVAHLSDLISPGGEAFWPVGSLALDEPRGQCGIAA